MLAASKCNSVKLIIRMSVPRILGWHYKSVSVRALMMGDRSGVKRIELITRIHRYNYNWVAKSITIFLLYLKNQSSSGNDFCTDYLLLIEDVIILMKYMLLEKLRKLSLLNEL